MDEPISSSLQGSYRAQAAVLAAELGEPVTWQSGVFVIRGIPAANPAAVRAIASGGTIGSDSQILARLIRKWGELYSFWWEAGQYHVERRDNGSRAHGRDATALELAIEEDYRASQPPPGEPPVITARTTI